MPPIGQRGFWLSVIGIHAAVVMWVSALYVYRRQPTPLDFLMLGLGIGAALAGCLGPGAARAVGEWIARSKDQSTIVDQTNRKETP